MTDTEPLYTEAEVAALLAACRTRTQSRAFAAGQDDGRRQTVAALKALSGLNGSTVAVMEWVRKAFDEGKIHRDHGQFAHTEGAGGDPTHNSAESIPPRIDSADGATATPPRTSDAETIHSRIDSAARTLAARIADVPAHLARRVSEWVGAKYKRLASRYGETGAKAILGAMVLLTPVPLPGTSLLPVAVAEAVLRIRQATTGEVKKGFDPNEARDESGEWTTSGGGTKEAARERPADKGGRETLTRPPETEDEARALATATRDVVVGEGDDVRATTGECVNAAAALAGLYPGAEIWHGLYNDDPDGEHKIVKIGDWFLDVTGDQFEGGSPILVFPAAEMGRYRGEAAPYASFRPDEHFVDHTDAYQDAVRTAMRQYEHTDGMLGKG